MLKILLLISGGALGTLFRYAVTGMTHRFYETNFPLGTLIVNISGSFFIGFIWSFWEQSNLHTNVRTFVFIGVLGGYTTFSSFAIETLNLFRDGEIKSALINIAANNFLGLIFVFVGFILAKWIINLLK